MREYYDDELDDWIDYPNDQPNPLLVKHIKSYDGELLRGDGGPYVQMSTDSLITLDGVFSLADLRVIVAFLEGLPADIEIEGKAK